MAGKNKRKSPAAYIIIGLLLLFAGLFILFGLKRIPAVRGVLLPLKYEDELKDAADRYGLDRRLVAALINAESGFDKDAVSVDGAEGLMQILPSTAEWIAFRRGIEYREGSLFEPETNLDLGCWFLSFLLDRYEGNVRYALIAYNAGYARLDEWLKTRLDDNGELTDIPYAETRNYVKKITDLIEKYGKAYEKELMDQ